MKQRRSRNKSTPRTAFRLETLERRILLSADLPFVAEGFTSVDPNSSQFVSTHNSDDASNNSDQSASETASLPTVELVVIDSSTPDYLSIFEDLQQSSSSRVEIFVLDSDRGG
ncbi:MAG: LEPR-XLL domain-containing protein, partial [Gammaproteobacteria bacterium]|nr:LEPR-XLL domain-containing protein [Gammaproteobacteria bacterium]